MPTPAVQHVPIGSIKPNPSNPRTIRDERFHKLVQSIKDFPEMLELRPIVTGADRVVLGGNMRLKACKAAGLKTVPVVVADHLTESQRREFIVKDNVGFGDWDWDALANEWDAGELEAWGLEVPDSAQEAAVGLTDPDAVPDVPDEPITKPGDLWLLGRHRLLCGDATVRDDVARLMGADKAEVVFTDPPYGVNVNGAKSAANGKLKIVGDITQTAIPFSFDLAVQMATTDTARLYFCGGENNLGMYGKLFDRYLNQQPRHLVWVKNGFAMKPNGYHCQYEIIYHGYKPGGGDLSKWYGARTEDAASDVWQIARDPSSSYLHPTQKPVALALRAITNSCSSGGIVYEPFGGSGSTLIACETSGRACRGIELDPRFCDVIVRRWEEFTGQKAIREQPRSSDA
jgi:DNA modification methylase